MHHQSSAATAAPYSPNYSRTRRGSNRRALNYVQPANRRRRSTRCALPAERHPPTHTYHVHPGLPSSVAWAVVLRFAARFAIWLKVALSEDIARSCWSWA